MDAYTFFLRIGPLSNVNEKYYKNDVAFWNEMMKHPNYDEFWQARNLAAASEKYQAGDYDGGRMVRCGGFVRGAECL